MRNRRTNEFIEIPTWDDIPSFANECEEAAYWGTHSLSERLLEGFEPRPAWMDKIRRTTPEEFAALDKRLAELKAAGLEHRCPDLVVSWAPYFFPAQVDPHPKP